MKAEIEWPPETVAGFQQAVKDAREQIEAPDFRQMARRTILNIMRMASMEAKPAHMYWWCKRNAPDLLEASWGAVGWHADHKPKRAKKAKVKEYKPAHAGRLVSLTPKIEQTQIQVQIGHAAFLVKPEVAQSLIALLLGI